jgi:hypothetical protein
VPAARPGSPVRGNHVELPAIPRREMLLASADAMGKLIAARDAERPMPSPATSTITPTGRAFRAPREMLDAISIASGAG